MSPYEESLLINISHCMALGSAPQHCFQEASSITPSTILLHFRQLETLLLECKLMEKEGGSLLPHAGDTLWCCDEKGLAGLNASYSKNLKAVVPKSVRSTRQTSDKSFGHLTLLPFVSLSGTCAPPFLIAKGGATLKAWKDIWPSATIVPSDSGSCTTSLFSQFLGLFGRYIRETCGVDKTLPIVLILDSGGGSQIHISPEASLIADIYGVRLFFFGRNMTPAVCPLDQRPNAEAEKRFHLILSANHDMSPLGAVHAAREAGYILGTIAFLPL